MTRMNAPPSPPMCRLLFLSFLGAAITIPLAGAFTPHHPFPITSPSAQASFPSSSSSSFARHPRPRSTLAAESSPSLSSEINGGSHNSDKNDDVMFLRDQLHDFAAEEDPFQKPPAVVVPDDDDDLDWFRFASIDELYNPAPSSDNNNDDVLNTLDHSTVAVVGPLAKMGSWAAEALARSAVGHLVLVDLEDICVSQTTDNLSSLKSNVGQLQIDALAARLPQIRPSLDVQGVADFVSHAALNALAARLEHCTVVMDTLPLESKDDAALKVAFWKAIAAAQQQSSGGERIPTKIISLGNPQGKLDPTRVQSQTLDQMMARDPPCDDNHQHQLWQWCHEQMLPEQEEEQEQTSNAPASLRPQDITCVYSDETPLAGAFGRDATGSVCFVTGTFGFVAAAKALDLILGR